MDRKPKQGEPVTIVGGRPMHRAVAAEQLPQGVEQVLTVAALDHRFRDEVARDPIAAATRKGIWLDQVEATLLRSTNPARLADMARRLIIPPGVARRDFVKVVSASIVALVTGKAMLLCSGCTGADAHWDDGDAGRAEQKWMSLAGHTCYVYVPAALIDAGPIAAPALVALHGEDETCLASVQRWHTAADNHHFFLLAINWTEEATTPESREQLIADLPAILRAFEETHLVASGRRFVTSRGQPTSLVWQAAYLNAAAQFAGAVLLGGVPAGDWINDAATQAALITATPALYYVMGFEDVDYAAATACYSAALLRGVVGHRQLITGSTNNAVLDFSEIWQWITSAEAGAR